MNAMSTTRSRASCFPALTGSSPTASQGPPPGSRSLPRERTCGAWVALGSTHPVRAGSRLPVSSTISSFSAHLHVMAPGEPGPPDRTREDSRTPVVKRRHPDPDHPQVTPDVR